MAGLPQILLRNWPLKLAALALAVILWAAVSAEETTSQLVNVRVHLVVPPSLALAQQPPEVRALVTAPGREMLKIHSSPLVLRATVPPGASPPLYRLAISPADVQAPRDARIIIQDVEPREIGISLDRFARRAVPVAVRGTVEPESGFALAGPLVLAPREVVVSGPRGLVMALDSLHTEAVEIRGVTDMFERTVAIDTSQRSLVGISPRQVTVTGRVRRL